MRNFRELKIWSGSLELAVEVYRVVSHFPPEEKYGLKSQIKRASVSISSNIAEGCSRTSQKEFRHFLQISLGSAFEVETQLILGNQLGMLTEEQLNSCLTQLQGLQKGINAFITKTRAFE